MKRFLFALLCALFVVALVPMPATHKLDMAQAAAVFAMVFITVYILNVRTNANVNEKAAGLVMEVWAAYIIERFYKDNPFLKKAFDDSVNVVSGRIVHIPQIGPKPTVVKNRNSFPAVAVRRTDTEVLYALDEYTTDPTHIPNIDTVHLSYSKQDSVLGEHQQGLDETVADDMLNKWAGNSTVFSTTGGPTAATVAGVGSQTGTRKAFHHKDLQKLMVLMNTANVPKTERYIMIDDNMYEYFYDSLSDNQSRQFSEYVNARDGVVGRLHGFDIMTRSSVLNLSSANAVKALGAAAAATDNLASIAWQKNTVAFAIGDKKLFQDTGNPLYYGDIYSELVMAGGRVRRADGLGVFTVAQGA